MWEYNLLDFSYKIHSDLEEKLQQLGDDNWEIITYFEVIKEKYDRIQRVKILAKRPKSNVL